MREILFRGKRCYNGEWVYGNLVVDKNDKPHIVPKDYFYEDGHHLQYYDDTDKPVFLDPETVGQFTGLTDKNGTKIFEGDILEGVDYDEEYGFGIVTWYDGAFWIENGSWCGTFCENYNATAFEVIGNIHDNPELIGGADNEKQ